MDSKLPVKILILGGTPESQQAIQRRLDDEGYSTAGVPEAVHARRYLSDGVAVLVADIDSCGTSAMEVLQLAKQHAPHAVVILISKEASIDRAVVAVREGAFDYLTKPVDVDQLFRRVDAALKKRALAAEIAELHNRLGEEDGLEGMVGSGSAMRSLYEKIRLVADTRSTVLITGESGTGKELVARSIHRLSQRSQNNFVPMNCAAIPEALLESELFGHEKGAFTGANDAKKGFFQAAERGTLFIDEIGELAIGLQSKLLRAIENRRITRVGSTEETPVDVRLVAATNRDLSERVAAGHFREDLFYRLKVVELKLPPLRERREDIPLLVRHFITEISADTGRPVTDIDAAALDMMMNYSWPGNVRELRNTLEGIIVLSMKRLIEPGDLPAHISDHTESQAIIQPGMTMAEIEKEAIRRTLQHTGGNRTHAADILGISVRTLQRKIKEYDLPL